MCVCVGVRVCARAKLVREFYCKIRWKIVEKNRSNLITKFTAGSCQENNFIFKVRKTSLTHIFFRPQCAATFHGQVEGGSRRVQLCLGLNATQCSESRVVGFLLVATWLKINVKIRVNFVQEMFTVYTVKKKKKKRKHFSKRKVLCYSFKMGVMSCFVFFLSHCLRFSCCCSSGTLESIPVCEEHFGRLFIAESQWKPSNHSHWHLQQI